MQSRSEPCNGGEDGCRWATDDSIVHDEPCGAAKGCELGIERLHLWLDGDAEDVGGEREALPLPL